MGIITDQLRKRNKWWEHNFWKVDLVLDVIFFAGLFIMMWYIIQYDCSDVYEECRKMCEHCNVTHKIGETIKGQMINNTSIS